jgi:hypothetical protein
VEKYLLSLFYVKMDLHCKSRGSGLRYNHEEKEICQAFIASDQQRGPGCPVRCRLGTLIG